MRNSELPNLNRHVADRFPGSYQTYYAVDKAESGDIGSDCAERLYTREYLRSTEQSGLPPSVLQLKVGMPVMLLRNIRCTDGLCNGTRLIVVALGRRFIQARKIGAVASDKTVYIIPRISLHDTESGLPFTLTRRQTPVRPCFAMTVNKSQGQSLYGWYRSAVVSVLARPAVCGAVTHHGRAWFGRFDASGLSDH